VKELTDDNLEVFFDPTFLSELRSDALKKELLKSIAWQQNEIRLFGKWITEPRLSAWYGDEGITYAYSGLALRPLPWTNELLQLKNEIENVSNAKFNSVLLNQYRHGQDSMGWHSDDEKELGKNPEIASLSLGVMREFQFRKKADHTIKHKLLLPHGSLLIMKGATQHFWQHQLPKRKRVNEVRINLTFRQVFSNIQEQ